MGILGHLNGQPLEPEMGAFWSLMLLPMVPNVTLSGYGFVPFANPEVAKYRLRYELSPRDPAQEHTDSSEERDRVL